MKKIPKFLLSTVLAASGVLLGCQQSISPEPAEYADTVLFNGKLYTLDEQYSWAEAVAIKDGRFMAVGSSEEILALAGPNTQRQDMAGAMAIPGITDSHFHTHNVIAQIDCNPGVFKPAQLRQILQDCKAKQVPGYPWLVVNGLEMWEDGKVDNRILNELFPDTPVVVKELSQHLSLVNDKALALAGVDANTPDPEGGKIIRHPKTGKPTGLMVEVGAVMLINSIIPNYPDEILQRELQVMFNNILAQGITSIQDAFILDPHVMGRLNTLDRNGGRMPYVFAHMGWLHDQPQLRLVQENMIRNRHQYRSRHVSPNGVKVLIDGVPVPPKPTHVPLRPDGEVDETNLLIPRKLLLEKLLQWDKAGLRLKMHAAGEGSVRVALDAIEAMRNINGDSGVWHDVVHTSDVAAVDMSRFKGLRATAEMSPYFWHLGGIMGSTGYQFRTLYNNGATITIGSDYNVVESFNPFPPLQGMVTRGDESVSLQQALTMFIKNPALVVNRLDDFGSIEDGKIANLVVLDQNLFSIDSQQIGKTQVVQTYLDGQLVYQR